MFVLRPAQMRDAFLFLEWRNDPDAVANSTTNKVIGVLDHLPWYQAILTDPTRRVYVAQWDGQPVGYGRLKGIGVDDAVELTICVAAPERGQGYGKRLVTLLCREATQLGCRQVWALVKATNMASRRCFDSTFQPDDVTQPWITYRRRL